MTKKRKIEVLRLLKQEMKDSVHSGLCFANVGLNIKGVITDDEYEWIKKLIYKNKPHKGLKSWYWEKYKIPPRIKWCDERIKELQ